MKDMQFKGPAHLIQGVILVGTIATVASLILFYMDETDRLLAWEQNTIVWADTALCAVMIAEWFILLSLCQTKWAFVKARWIDLLASMPLLLLFRPLRILRLLRLLRLLRGISHMRRFMKPWEIAFDAPFIRVTVLVAILLILLASVGIMDVERDNPMLDEFGEAVWWSVVTASTVGYGDRYPGTVGGRFIAVTLMITGLGLFGALTASISSAIMMRGQKDITNRDIADRLEALEAHMVELLENLTPPNSKGQ